MHLNGTTNNSVSFFVLHFLICTCPACRACPMEPIFCSYSIGVKFLPRETALLILFNWGMPMRSEVYPVELLRRSTRRDSTGEDFTGVAPADGTGVICGPRNPYPNSLWTSKAAPIILYVLWSAITPWFPLISRRPCIGSGFRLTGKKITSKIV